MTPEQRTLLEGDEQRAARNQQKMGWADATSSARIPRIAERIAQIRAHLLTGHTTPPPISAEYRTAAERAYAIEQRLFPTRANQRTEQPADRGVENLRLLLSKASIF